MKKSKKMFLAGFALLGVSIVGLSFKTPTVNASNCSYITEDGVCMIVKDKNNDVPVIDGQNNTTTDDKKDNIEAPEIDEKITVDIKDAVEEIDDKANGIGNIEYIQIKTEEKYLAEIQETKNNKALNVDEQCYLEARKNGDDTVEASKACISINMVGTLDVISSEIKANKSWYEQMFSQLNSDTFKEAMKKFGDFVQGLFGGNSNSNSSTSQGN